MSVTTDEVRNLQLSLLVSGVTVTGNSGKSQYLTSLAYLVDSLDAEGRHAF